MRSLIFLGFLLFTTPVFAFSDSFIDFCLTTQNPKACLLSASEFKQSHQLQQQQDAYHAQLEQARIHANGLAMVGMGAAFVNGMNQGFRPLPMPVMPTMQPVIPLPMTPAPIRCISSNPGAMQSITCY